MEKSIWQKPELISLTRCQQQEAVLDTCKYVQIPGDPATFCVACRQTQPGAYCVDCAAMVNT